MEFRLLGTVGIDTESGGLTLGPPKRSSLLAALLLLPNRPVPVSALGKALWEGEPPVRARSVVQGHISHLRTLIEASGGTAHGVDLVTHTGAYELRTPAARVDSARFKELVRRARTQSDAAESVRLLHQALALWQGPALTGTTAGPLLLDAARALEEERVGAVEQLADAYGALEQHGRAAAELGAEIAAYPLRESLAAALVLALHRSGQRAQAVERYHHTRRLLSEELGVCPGPRLTQAFEEVLRPVDRLPGGLGPRKPPGLPRGAFSFPRDPLVHLRTVGGWSRSSPRPWVVRPVRCWRSGPRKGAGNRATSPHRLAGQRESGVQGPQAPQRGPGASTWGTWAPASSGPPGPWPPAGPGPGSGTSSPG
ncbi:hypothetical protein A8W25_15650 [Streptomyces sp. ERV7]|uniref:AfsR/SARP family transcriptional regulator n=1 Tax=Streptomyces sp. ERV7 TaxID=1322334 RepID=UPI0007F45370|nr:BTAD domain-containing putative transcriptional regulator [Streptomyces sp. ERV7]OAR23916.1 hypothetical protein A8W25_15650 [Streptomyces sp. ERV7]